MDLSTLPALTALSNNISIVEYQQLKLIRVLHEKATAAISLFGGHVVSFAPNGQDDLIWMSQESKLDGKTAIRGGIPLCWPWFGRIANPAHGFARIQEWSLVEHRESDEGVVVTLGLSANDETRAIWPYEFSLLLHVAISDTLDVQLEIINTDAKAWTFSGALHSYLNVGDIEQVTTTGMGAEYIDKLLDSKICQGGDVLQLTDTIDRVYTQPEDKITVTDPVLKRQTLVENSGHNSAVLWNPWAAGSHSMGDMQDDAYLTMLCVESTIHAPCLSSGITLQPKEKHTLTTHIGYHSL
ncbi:D-hexose-6-phosphate mutarotase [Vibrio sp. RC27]